MPEVTPLLASCVVPIPLLATLSVTSLDSAPPPVKAVPAMTWREVGTPATDNKSPALIL